MAIKLDVGTVGRREESDLIKPVAGVSPIGGGDVIEIGGTFGPILRRLRFFFVTTAFMRVAFQVVDDFRLRSSASCHDRVSTVVFVHFGARATCLVQEKSSYVSGLA